MKKMLLGALALIIGTCALYAQKDPAQYDPKEGVTLESVWIKSLKTKNFTSVGARSIAVAKGKVYLSDQANRKLHIYDPKKGDLLSETVLPEILFSDAGWIAAYHLRSDKAGNLLFMNIATNLGVSPFQVWKMADENSEPTKILNYTDPAGNYVRIDYGAVYGDVNGSGYIIAAVSPSDNDLEPRTLLRWDISDGVVKENPKVITLPSTYGYSTVVYPASKNMYYVDGTNISPTAYDSGGEFVDGFINAGGFINPGLGANGVCEFTLGDDYFLLTAAANSSSGVDVAAANSFFVYKLGEFGVFDGMSKLYNIPQAGMGETSMTVASDCVVEVVSETRVNIYVHAPYNGFAKYTMFADGDVSIDEIALDDLTATVADGKIILSEEVVSVEVYSITGQAVGKAFNTDTLDAPNGGLYILKAISKDGTVKSLKLIVD